ncbi:MAG: folate-binding protein, partial [Actinomycetota bacterium]|nr:folate-binding protein [Actinomycetota bacterium]
MTSPLLDLPGAVPALPGSPDAGVAWHHGDPLGEQRAAERDV